MMVTEEEKTRLSKSREQVASFRVTEKILENSKEQYTYGDTFPDHSDFARMLI